MKHHHLDWMSLCKTTATGKIFRRGKFILSQDAFHKQITNPNRTLIKLSHPAADQFSNRLVCRAKKAIATQNKKGNQLLQTNLFKFIGIDACK